ncbi:uncharacterized protein PHALS_02467 [Plasmopara halstedii]|uniref:Uncharacterized protein n=1 Tax=Plasmopara halstedii TaxID=4781 RepID=A0A0N7L3N6_PLAHL|nr:uncharacterized protein PHALS_02467 [Plasmopara halstedii]CEG36379.1 hypothetical protein PHALS_02467 [Plasmopara halstedii]|eukprot:XP_024572748.1 hypothetical protein PHALS_02467 [Plasmopara halstedii]
MNATSARSDQATQQTASTAILPRYMQPTFSSILPEYANAETEQIRKAFGTGNFTNIQIMPTRLHNNAVNQARFEKMNENRINQSKVGKNFTQNGFFSRFEYMPSQCNDEQARTERLRFEAKRSEISSHDFLSGGSAARLKHEDAFGALNFRYPHLYEPYPDNSEKKKLERLCREKKILHGPFVPSGQRPRVTRMLTPQIMIEMHEAIAADWQGLKIAITPTQDEHILVCFNDSSLRSTDEILAYMNVFCKTNRVACKYGLCKATEDWNFKSSDGRLYFAFRPPWVKNRSKNLVNGITR